VEQEEKNKSGGVRRVVNGRAGCQARRNRGTNKEHTLYNLRVFAVMLLDRLSKLWLRLGAPKPLQLLGRVDTSGCLGHRGVSGEVQHQGHLGRPKSRSSNRCWRQARGRKSQSQYE
jgi:hypothetical protein